MIDLLASLNSNAAGLTALLTAVMMLATVVYALLTAVLVRETRRMREAQTEPRIEIVAAPLEQSINVFTLQVRNIGPGPAHDVLFALSGKKSSAGETELIKDFSKSQFLVTGLNYLGPGRHLRSGFTQINQNFAEKIKAELVVRTSYRSSTGKLYNDEILINFAEYEGYGQLGREPTYAIAQSMEKLERHVGWLVTGFKKLPVDLYTREDREQEAREREEFLAGIEARDDDKDPNQSLQPTGLASGETGG